jgi:4-hydroxy-tetrahydrodipicolinate synthase
MKSVTFEGVFPILVTPFDDEGNLDLASFDRTIRFMADIGVDGVTIIGVLGESNRMKDSEREQLIKTAVFAADDRIPVVVGTSHSGTAVARDLSQMAESLGAGGVMVTPSREPVPNESRIFEYFAQVSDGMSIPLVVQDHPASTQVNMSIDLLLRLVNEIELVSCIKEEAVPTPPRITNLLNGMTNRSVPILTGLGALYGGFDLARGSHGFMTGFAFPEVLIAMVKAAREKQFDTVNALYHRYLPLIVFEQQPGVAVRKEIFRLRGLIDTGTVRHPGANIDPQTKEHLVALLDNIFPNIDLTKPLEI